MIWYKYKKNDPDSLFTLQLVHHYREFALGKDFCFDHVLHPYLMCTPIRLIQGIIFKNGNFPKPLCKLRLTIRFIHFIKFF